MTKMSCGCREDRADWITVDGARTNNLKDVSVRVPKHRITVFTGVSGSGKSSLAFGTIASEAQRLVADSYPLFVRNRLPRLGRAEVEHVDGLTFTTVVDQHRFTGNARSTVGTASDIAPLVRMLFSRMGEPSAGYSPAYSFNDPSGMCPTCEGLGTVEEIDLDALLDLSLSLDQGAIRFPTFRPGTYRWKRMVHSGLVDPALPLAQVPDEDLHTLLCAEDMPLDHPDPRYPRTSNFDGVIPRLRATYLRKTPSRLSEDERAGLSRVVIRRTCPECAGARLNRAARSSLIDGRSIVEWQALPVAELRSVVSRIRDPRVAPLTEAITERCDALDTVGLGYLSLDRLSTTLSGGEAQRVKTVRHLGSPLSDVCYVFDEPSAGLHPHDVHLLLALLTRLRDAHNTVLVVEHNSDVIRTADHVIDLGPGAGNAGGHVRFEGSPAELRDSGTTTGQLRREPVPLNTRPRRARGAATIREACSHNLRGVTVDVPLQVFTAVSGVAGSGKSTLMVGELSRQHKGFCVIGQEPLRANARSTVSTILEVAEPIRKELGTATGMDPSWFSPNGRGACPTCTGRGILTTDLAFLDDITTTCEACHGTGFNSTALSAHLDGHTIADILAMTASRCADLFASHPRISRRLGWLEDVGLGHLGIGRGTGTLSGGERQRLLLARHLADSPATSRLRIVLDEPTVGLHGVDVDRLLALFDRLVDKGATIVAIEHNLRVIAHADHVIDLGPGAGNLGGTVVYQGTPAGLVSAPNSLTGTYLRRAVRAE
ncbi:MAG: ATP-binding cassette domain-containing protein [Propionibacterium sp.]|nr:ATP-binding cassette domain-containing protein [Propionibacterium sp.]